MPAEGPGIREARREIDRPCVGAVNDGVRLTASDGEARVRDGHVVLHREVEDALADILFGFVAAELRHRLHGVLELEMRRIGAPQVPRGVCHQRHQRKLQDRLQVSESCGTSGPTACA